MRRVAWVVAVGWHLLVAVVLVWLMYQQYVSPAHPQRKGQEDVVQVEFIGQGAAEEVGGGAQSVPSPAAGSAATVTPLASQQAERAPSQPPSVPREPVEPPPAVAAVPPATPPLAVAPEEVVEPIPPEMSQSVQVSEAVPDMSSDYVLPPPTPRIEVPKVTLEVPDRTLPVPEVAVVEVPTRQAPALAVIAARPISDVSLDQAVPDVVVREIAAPLPAAPSIKLAQPVIPVYEQPLTSQPLRERTISSPPSSAALATRPAASQTSDAAPAQSEKAAAAVSEASVSVASSAASAATSPSQSAGPKAAQAPGGWSSPKRADDWGDSTRAIDGGQKGKPSGLYNSDGSVRVGDAPGSAAPGRPPGEITDEIVNLDRGGTWLKRKPTDYEPTSFDRYWRPNESLLEEWVRKSITTVRIPIPGTNKHVVCTTVMLVLGGGCDISDPNLLDVPPTARAAPDVPFKPALQENNGSLPDPVE